MLDIRNLRPVVPYGSNCYLLSSAGEYAVIDPSADYSEAVKAYPEIEGRVKYVLLTHAHFDHMLAINSWADKCETVYVGDADSPALSDAAKNCYLGFLGVDDGYYGAYQQLKEGDIIRFGDEVITVIACPGHTPGGVSYKIGNDIFCGDTAFAGGGYGRCDLPGGDFQKLKESIARIHLFAPDTDVYPGHGEKTKVKEIIRF